MKKTITILLAALLLISLCVSCNNGSIVDDAFTCIVTFDGNGADTAEQTQQRVSKGVGISLKGNTFIKDGFCFLWWNTEANGSGTDYFNGQHICFDEDLTLYAQWGILISEDTTALTDGNRYTLNRSVEVAERLTVTGNVSLILPDGYRLTAQKGISVNEGNSLTIDSLGSGTGELAAIASDDNTFDAAIGGEEGFSSGLITIYGGNVTATYGGSFGAAIGGGRNGSGTVTIYGGNVTVTNKSRFGAAIGGGDKGNGTVTIYDGNVNVVYSDGHAAAIGGGTGKDGTVTINGGNVTATSTEYGAAIGGGGEGNGTVTINGGSVTVTSKKYGAAIGGGDEGNGTVTINGGTVTAIGEFDGPGIGCGYGGSGGSLTINGGTVFASGRDYGAGIGGAYTGSGIDVTINGGQVLAIGGEDEAAGIGKGRSGANDGTLTLGEGVALEVSSNCSDWSDYDGTTRQRYMRTK